jgi:hypothetical protein
MLMAPPVFVLSCLPGSIMYDVFLWQDLTWPSFSLSWLPQGWQQAPGVSAAEAAARAGRRDDFDEHAAAAAAATLGEEEQGEETETATAIAAAAGADEAHQPPPPQHSQLVQMPVDYQYLLLGSQTSGQGTAKLQLYRVEIPGQLGALQPQQQVLMQKGDIELVMVSEGDVLE